MRPIFGFHEIEIYNNNIKKKIFNNENKNCQFIDI